ncbi:unnamed protein product (macronuclear) [Paramecium tetraurelia]|uniref:Tyrosine specific protein phosphatases domain-containing protein n=1 Tax=Paramecium tetraurelia TaxID=5888 RepID=A0DP38_PARTE|nr:uncharacterized protein GSPATT00018986001 [Paramecium tetraurelia]CAK84805.1 unnamed protein product [Paramecium tetraurelia]|eukprot:XP_001452202.1 hypothetical protein (macronuclear) [Paramecium tetraurelia strain d4-2]
MRVVLSLLKHLYHQIQIIFINRYHQLMIRQFDEVADFIHNHLKNGNVLVHCYAGISRSASLLIAYLIKYHNYTTLTTINFIKARPIIEPNDGNHFQDNQDLLLN